MELKDKSTWMQKSFEIHAHEIMTYKQHIWNTKLQKG